MIDLEVIKKDLKNILSEYRYEHSLRVADVCKELALIYGYDKDKAYLAGLVHDIAKEFDYEENKYYINKYNLPDFGVEFKKIIHSYVGSVYLKEKYDMDDDICKAVRVHTTASIDMNLLDKIVFVADKIELGKKYPGIEEERIIAKEDINKALLLCLENNYKRLSSQGRKMYPDTLEVLSYLRVHNK